MSSYTTVSELSLSMLAFHCGIAVNRSSLRFVGLFLFVPTTINVTICVNNTSRGTTRFKGKTKGKAIPVIGLDRFWGFQDVRAPNISTQSAHESGKIVSSTHLPPRRYHWYSFLLEADHYWYHLVIWNIQ